MGAPIGGAVVRKRAVLQAPRAVELQRPVPTRLAPKVVTPPSVKIQSPDFNALLPTPNQTRSAHHPVDLNFSTASSTSSSFHSTANISHQDFPVFTTDPQSTWLPNSPSLPASSAHRPQSPAEPAQQDFVLFDSPQPRPLPNRSASLSSQRRHSSYHNRRQQSSASPAAQNQRVAQLLHAIGQSSSSPLNTNNANANQNRFANQFYASSAPSSSVTLHQQQQSRRPPVPLFHQSTGQIQTANMMNAADVDLDDFIAMDGGQGTAFSSPAIPSGFDFNGSTASSTSNLGTVSPQDLLVQEPFMSAPNSTALTSLTSPSIYNESPDFDEFDVSPHFGGVDFDGSGDPWYPLFPQDSAPEQNNLEDSPAQKSDDVDSVERGSGGGGRRKSAGSPTSTTGRHSSVAGVNSRKRDKPLPAIIVEDPNDVVAMKRARNTLAARKSRERKAHRFDELEDRIAKLEEERDHWKQIALGQTGSQ